MDLAQELADREITAYELAKAAGLTPQAVYAIKAGQRQGRPRTRRALRAALRQFPVVEDDDVEEPRRTAPVPRQALREKALSAALEGRELR